MHSKATLGKQCVSFILSWCWAIAGIAVFTAIENRLFLPDMAAQFGGNLAPLKPLFWGACIAYFLVAWFMVSGRRLPYADNFEVLFSITFAMACLLVALLAAMREYYSGRYIATWFAFMLLWLGLEVFFRNRFVEYRFIVFPTDTPLKEAEFPEHKVVFDFSPEESKQANVDAVIVDANQALDQERLALLACYRSNGVPILPLTVFLESTWGRIPLELVTPGKALKALSFRPYLLVKPLLEWIIALLGVFLLSPAMLATAVVVRLTSRGPVLFRQARAGVGGQPFTMYKFRTMREGAEKLGSYAVVASDERLTPVGGLLRRYHLDELPQLFNVLKGDMAIVGPRPETVELTELYKAQLPYYCLRNVVRPGVTSWALIHQGNVSGVEATGIKLSYDLYYLKHMSFLLDFFIILKTVWVMLFGIETLRAPRDLRLFGKKGA